MKPAPLLAALALLGCKAGPKPTVPVVSSAQSKVYHLATCRYAKKIKPAKRIDYRDASLAVLSGRVPCRVCRPGEP
jgi:hypothetical protein